MGVCCSTVFAKLTGAKGIGGVAMPQPPPPPITATIPMNQPLEFTTTSSGDSSFCDSTVQLQYCNFSIISHLSSVLLYPITMRPATCVYVMINM